MNINRFKTITRTFRNAEGDDGGGGQAGESAAFTQAQVEEIKAELQSQIDSMAAKNDELLGEVKSNKKARREADEAARVAAEDKAKTDGDFEQLFKSSEERSTGLQSELDGLKSGIANEKRNGAAMKIATQLCEGDNVDLMSTFIAPRLKYTDEGVKVLNAAGELTVSTIADLQEEFKSNVRYSSLLKGNQSTGGGANGGRSSGATSKESTRADFDQMNPTQRSKFIRDGGKVVQ